MTSATSRSLLGRRHLILPIYGCLLLLKVAVLRPRFHSAYLVYLLSGSVGDQGDIEVRLALQGLKEIRCLGSFPR